MKPDGSVSTPFTDDKPRMLNFREQTRVIKPVGPAPTEGEERILLAAYAEVCSTWRNLHDARFKLLGLLPLVTLGVLALSPRPAEAHIAGLVAAVIVTALGWAVSHGLHIYDQRNSQLYNDLISRARRIEAELGLHHGAFRGRLDIQTKGISHGVATDRIYGAVKIAWAVALLVATVLLILALG